MAIQACSVFETTAKYFRHNSPSREDLRVSWASFRDLLRGRVVLGWRRAAGRGKLGWFDDSGMERMTAQVAIVCDRCGDIGTVGPTPQEARDALPDWIRRRGADLCPVCRAIDDARGRAAEISRMRTGDRIGSAAVEPETS